MTERATPAGDFFCWRDAGAGRRAIPCPRCERLTRVALLENLFEALCQGCGRSLVLERARQLESRRGPAALREALSSLGLEALPEPQDGSLVQALVEQGALQRDLRLFLALEPEAGTFCFSAAPLRELVLPAEVEQALERRRAQGGALAELLVELVRARLGASVRGVGRQAGLPSVGSLEELDPDCARALSPRAVAAFRAIPVRREQEALVVGLWDPLDAQALRDLEELVGGPVHGVLASPELIAQALERLGVSDPSEELGSPLGEAGPREAPPGQVSLEPLDDPFLSILLEALEEGAAEVLVEPRLRHASLRFRVRGELRRERALPSGVLAALAERLGAPEGTALHTGRVRCEVSGIPVQVSCRVLGTPLGPAVAILLDQELEPLEPALGELGLGLEQLARFEALLAQGRGLIVLAAPPRGGRTQAYYATLERAARLGGAALSVEERVTRSLRGVTQLERTALGGAPLGALLEPPPDWLGLDAALEPGLLTVALDACLTGAGVVLTVPAPGAELALLRLEAAGAPPALLRRTLACVVARRVVPRLCPRCRLRREPDVSPIRRIGCDPAALLDRTPWVGLGCPACADQGVSGQQALAELLLPASPAGWVVAGTSLGAQARQLLDAGEVPLEAVADLLA